LPPPTSAPAQRRFNFLIVGLTILLAAGLVGALTFIRNERGEPPAKDPAKTQVRNAYLSFYSSLSQAYKQLDMAPVQALLTPAGAQQQQAIILQAQQSGFRYDVSADHDAQPVVYVGGELASVDDVMLRRSVPIDASGSPAGPEVLESIHESTVMKKQGGRWLIDSIVEFGSGSSSSGGPVSYAAAARGKALPPGVSTDVDEAFRAFWSATTLAFKNLDAAPLGSVEIEPELRRDRTVIDQQRAKGQGYQTVVEHNYRAALQDDSTVWVYDTFSDSSYAFDVSSHKQVGPSATRVTRKSFEFRRVQGKWMVDFAIVVH
jgi:hypothetical protein